MNKGLIILLTLALVAAALLVVQKSSRTGSAVDSVVVQSVAEQGVSESNTAPAHAVTLSSRNINLATSISLPLQGSAPVSNVKHSIPIEEIHRGCFRQDCIPSVDAPTFVSVEDASAILQNDSIGIGLSYNNQKRFYAFDMLVTREIVNDTIADEPVLVTYCPLCGTGIVFERSVENVVYEFGVSGMLWQSNLLMYNRAESLEDRNLWSQVLGEAVVGKDTGKKLTIIPSNIVRFGDWVQANPDSLILNTGRVGDPYDGDYYGVAQNFNPNFSEKDSPIDPSTYVHGVEIDGIFKAYPDRLLSSGGIADTVGGTSLSITRSNIGEVVITDAAGKIVPHVTGFWFSWIAAHPNTELWENN